MKKYLLPFLLVAGLVFRLIISIQIYSGDVNNHVSWGQDILKFGPAGVYSRDFVKPYGTMTPTYPPIPLFIFTISKSLFDWVDQLVWDLNLRYAMFPSNLVFFFEDQDTQPAFFKIWAIAADVVIAYIVFLFARRQYLFLILVLFNPAFFYNSAYWGQVEALPIMFLILGLYLFYKNKLLLSSLSFIGALISKQSSIIFIPIIALMFFRAKNIKDIGKYVVASLALFWISFMPFLGTENPATFPITTYIEKIRSGSGSDYVTDHAFNLWALLTGLGKISDTLPFWGGVAYHWWGLSFFSVALILIFIPLFRKHVDRQHFFASFSLISFAAFLFLTRMHGRYLQPALAFLLLYCIERKKLLSVFIYLSIFYFLNLYHNWWAPRIPSLVDFISNEMTINLFIIGALFSFVIVLVDYYRMRNYEKYN